MTLDNVELAFDAAICIRVVDAQKAVTMLASGKRDVRTTAAVGTHTAVRPSWRRREQCG